MSETQVKCYYCGQSFFKSKEDYEKPTGNRYAHKICCAIHTKMQSVLGNSYNKKKITNQIKENVEQGRTPEEILKVLNY